MGSMGIYIADITHRPDTFLDASQSQLCTIEKRLNSNVRMIHVQHEECTLSHPVKKTPMIFPQSGAKVMFVGVQTPLEYEYYI